MSETSIIKADDCSGGSEKFRGAATAIPEATGIASGAYFAPPTQSTLPIVDGGTATARCPCGYA
jgi:hypothetical protein